MNIGHAIRFCRQQRKLSIPKLAKRAGLSAAYVSLLERDKRDPTFSTVEKLCAALEVPLSVLIFVATSPAEMASLSPEASEKLAAVTMRLLQTPMENSNQGSLV